MGIVFEDYRSTPSRSSEADLKVVFWNACRIHRGWDNVTAEARSWDADVIALVEAGRELKRPAPNGRPVAQGIASPCWERESSC